MKAEVLVSSANGRVKAPPSKSMAHRALIAAALSYKSSVKNLAMSEDIKATLCCLEALGAKLKQNKKSLTLGSLDLSKVKDGTTLYCNESGSTLRFMLALCLLTNKKITLKGSQRLFERPLSVYEDICKEQGIYFSKDKDSVTVCGRLKSGSYSVKGDVSSQFITGLLFALPLLEGDSTLTVTGKFESASYVYLTLSALKSFGIKIDKKDNVFYIKGNQKYNNSRYSVEGDYSNAAFLDAFSLLGGKVCVSGLKRASLQGDRVYKEFFKALKNGQKEFDLSDCPDLAPVMFSLAAYFEGARFLGTARLKIKESDRAQAMCSELKKFGVDSEIFENEVVIKKSELCAPKEELCTYNDHRIVMALTLLLTLTGGRISGIEAVNKSFPDFFEKIAKLGIGIKKYED